MHACTREQGERYCVERVAVEEIYVQREGREGREEEKEERKEREYD